MKTRLAEFNWLKMIAIFLLVFVHSELYFAYPDIFSPLLWIIMSCFFFVSGFLMPDSFHKRGESLKAFFKVKFWSLYIPFVAFAIFYFTLAIATGAYSGDPKGLLFHVSLLNVFEAVNSGLYNWGILWFIPHLLIFMFIFCLIEKYVKSIRFQVLLVAVMWFATILAWAFDSPMKLGQVFSQYFLIFAAGFFIKKFNVYQKVTSLKAALVTVPFIILSSLNFTGFFSLVNVTEVLGYVLYFNGRSVILGLFVSLLLLFFLRKIHVSDNRFVSLIAEATILIYLSEPFVSFMLKDYVFAQNIQFLALDASFYLYQAARIVILFVFMPFLVKAIKNYWASRKS